MSKRRSSPGVTLLEFLIGAVIVGLLVIIALPMYRKSEAKALGSEAKALLSGAYVAETSFRGTTQSYTACLAKAGFSAQGTRHYALGFSAEVAGGSNCGPGPGGMLCTTHGWRREDTKWVQTPGSQCDPVSPGSVWIAGSDYSAKFCSSIQAKPLPPPRSTLYGVHRASACQSELDLPYPGHVESGTFEVHATGFVFDLRPDVWSINQKKEVRHPAMGY